MMMLKLGCMMTSLEGEICISSGAGCSGASGLRPGAGVQGGLPGWRGCNGHARCLSPATWLSYKHTLNMPGTCSHKFGKGWCCLASAL